MKLKTILWLFLLLPATASAAYESEYELKDVKLGYVGQGSVTVATQDLRSYILSGDKKPEFTGLIRGAFGNAANVRTKSRKSLSEDFNTSIAAALANSGFSVKAGAIASTESAAQALERMHPDAPDRIVIVQLRDWKTDTYQNVKLHFDVTISVYDRSGTLLDSITDSGDTELKRPTFVKKPYVDPVEAGYRKMLETWLNDDKIRNALAATPVAAPAGTAQ